MSQYESDEICARCGKDISNECSTGESGLYNPGPVGILLCEPCFHDEEAEIDDVGTNNLPETLKAYYRVLEQHARNARPRSLSAKYLAF